MDSKVSQDSPPFELKDVVASLTSLTEVMQKMAIQFGAVEEKVNRLDRNSTPSKGIQDSGN